MIDELFRARAAEHPDRLAVVGDDRVLTYRELDDLAGRLATSLRHKGVRPGDVVGVRRERSATTVACLVAVLRVGAAYLALDRRWPDARTREILAATGVRVVLTGDEDLPADAGPAVTASPEHVAYVAYTSGSTGRPKGVCVPHRAVVRLVVGADYLAAGPDDVFVQYAPLAFDAATFEVWGALLNGARLVVPPPHDPAPAELTAFVRRSGGTVLWLTAGLFHQVVTAGLADLAGLRLLAAGGDVLSPAHVEQAIAALPDTTVVNGYGPTENTTFTCCHHIDRVPGGSVPIGRPITGTTAHVLDDGLAPAAAGELYTGGLGLAHGYFGDPGSTALRFVPDPFAAEPGARLYRTGDVVRRAADGVLEFVGRVDRQVKVRGFRVEPAEVEAALTRLPGVTGAAVVPARDPAGEVRLDAFTTGSASAADLRRSLLAVLPAYAVPARITQLDAFPLTDNGKLDRAALAEHPATARPVLSTEHRPPASAAERFTAQVWTDLLGIDGIGADDDFFELGGHSLIGVKVVAALHAEYGVRLSPVDFYLDPTPAGLARAVDSARQEVR